MKVIVGIGVPGCGKTTYLKPLAEELNLTYINADDIREELTGDPTNHTREIKVWAIVRRRLKQAIAKNGAVLDATHSKKRDRRVIVEYCRENGADNICAYWFNLPLNTCLERNNKRDRKVPEEAAKKMYDRLNLNPPRLEEGFDVIVVLTD